jgi:hypothetical protein
MLGELIAVAERLENESEARRALGVKERDRIYTRLWVEHAERYPDFHRPTALAISPLPHSPHDSTAKSSPATEVSGLTRQEGALYVATIQGAWMLRGKVILPERNGAGRSPTKAASILPGSHLPRRFRQSAAACRELPHSGARQPSRVPVRQERDHQRRIV